MPSPSRQCVPPDAQDLAANRLRFLTTDQPEPSRVRPMILASWRRSRALNVAADKLEMAYVRDPDIDTSLTRSAEPVLRRLHEQLVGQPVSILLTDAAGLVLSRRTADAGLERHLDRVLLAPGFSYAERLVGTNGIGTALEAGSATQVFGHEHYAENLEGLACAGVPIHNPTSGRLMGVIDLTCWRRHAESLLLTLAKATAEQIQQAIAMDSSHREFEVLQAYRQTCRRTTGIVFAVTDGAVLVNDRARADLDRADQAVLLARAVETGAALAAGRRRSVAVLLPSGAFARMYCQQVGSDSERAGLVVHVKVGDVDDRSQVRHLPPTHMLLPGLVGSAPPWQRACQQVERTVALGSWLAVDGEPGAGKLALLRAVQLRQHPPRRFVVLDAECADRHWMTTVQTALAEADSVIVTHVDALDMRAIRTLSAALQTAKDNPSRFKLWVAVTLRPGATRPELTQLLSLFPTTVPVPPLRLRLEDLPALVSFLLAQVSHSGHVTCSPEATRLLMRSTWPGNVAQLQHVLQHIVVHRRAGSILPEDLPPELHSITRRVLTPLESMERDAIVRSLADTHGNKVQAARSLGMLRATIYRKLHEFGIVTPS